MFSIEYQFVFSLMYKINYDISDTKNSSLRELLNRVQQFWAHLACVPLEEEKASLNEVL